MQRTLTLDDRSFGGAEASVESFCLVCGAAVNAASSTNIFYTSLPRNGELLASFVLRVLRPVANDLRSSYICSRCNQLFQMLEQAQWTVSNIRCEILKVYHSRESEKLLERKSEPSVAPILPDELFAESEDKIPLQSDRFEDINEFRALHVGSGGNGTRNDAFDDSANDFCNLNIEIDNSDRKIEIRENGVYGGKIDGLRALDVERGGNIARSESYDDSPNDFRNLNEIDDADKKIEKPLGVRENSVYESKIDCLKTLDAQLDGNLARSDNFDDPQNDFCNLNIAIDDCDKRDEKSLEICETSVNGSKIDCLKPLTAGRDENFVGSDTFGDSPNDFCNLNSEIDNYDNKIEEPVGISQNVVSEPKVDDLKVEEAIEESKEREDEGNFENCSRNLVAKISSDLLLNSKIDESEGPPKSDKKAQYTMQCRMCPRLFRFARHLRAHSLKHGGSRPYSCRKCDERFADLSLANSHAAEMHSAKRNCIVVATEPPDDEVPDFTGEDFVVSVESENNEDSEGNNKRPSKSGRISKYSLKPLKYPCSTCGKKWRTSAELKTHVKSHSNLRPYMCEKCGQAYKHKNALEIHVGMHNGVSPYQCNVCNKCFTQKGALMRHLPMHTGEMPYQCELCGKRFVHHTSYNMHALSHTGKKSYQCHVCDLSLLSTSHLKRHMRVHTGEKPYSCELCGKSFAERYNLFAHQKIHDPAEIMAKAAKKITYKCEQCDEFFDKKQKLDDHTKGRHGSAANASRWIGHTVDVVNPAKSTDVLADQSWPDYNYSKLQSVVVGMKTAQNDGALAQISHESIALLMSQASYNKGLAVMIQPTNSVGNAEIDQTQI